MLLGIETLGSAPLGVSTVNILLIPEVTGVEISPVTAIGSQQFTATVIGLNSPSQEVNWSKVGGGTLTNTGLFIAPEKTIVEQIITIKATSVANSEFFSTATITIAALVIPVPEVTGIVISPLNPVIEELTKKQFSAFIQGNNEPKQGITWNTTLGEIDSTGLLTVGAANTDIQLGTVIATSIFYPSFEASTDFTIPAITIITPDDPNYPDPIPVDPRDIVVAPNRILKTKAGNFTQREEALVDNTMDTYFRSNGLWVIFKDYDDSLFYGLDIGPDLVQSSTHIKQVIMIVKGVELDYGPYAIGSMIVVKIKGGDMSDDLNTINSMTFRITCANGETFDRSIFFVIREQ